MRVGRIVVCSAILTLAAGQAPAMFRASDTVIVPVAAATPGFNGANWRTDLEIFNADLVPLDVEIVLLPSGGGDNMAWFGTIQNHLGGRESGGFVGNKLDARLKDIPAGTTVTIDDVVAKWGSNLKGALVVFAYEPGTAPPTTTLGKPDSPRKIIVNSRTYSLGSDAAGKPLTYGQQIPGLPWWYRVNPGAAAQAAGLETSVLLGVRNDSLYRTSLGAVNVSGIPLTVQLRLLAAEGTRLGTVVLTLSPLAHVQFDRVVSGLFAIKDRDVVGGVVEVTIISDISVAGDPLPGLVVYASRIDNATNDPSYIEQTFESAELPWDCVLNGNCPAHATVAAIPSTGASTAAAALTAVPPSPTATALTATIAIPGAPAEVPETPTAVARVPAEQFGAMFRASDLVIVPAAAAMPGLNSSNWRTDLEIYNADTSTVDVEIVLLSTGGQDNMQWFNNIQNHLGGRESDGFGKLNAKLKDISPGTTVVIEDIVKTWGENMKGALLVFAYEAGTLTTTTPKGGNPKKVLVTSRTYSLGADAAGKPLTYGQQIPGLPWWDTVNPGAAAKAKGLDVFALLGIRGDDRFRTSVGLVNVSDRLTSVSVLLRLVAADGTELAKSSTTLGPLAHEQLDSVVTGFFALKDTIVVGAVVEASIESYVSSAENPAPALMVYASRVDNVTNDPSYVEQAFKSAELPWACVYEGNCPVPAAAAATQSTRVASLRPPVALAQ